MFKNTLYYVSTVNYLYERRKCYSLSCPILCNPMNCSPSGSSVHGILQAGILKSVAIPFSRGPLDPGIEPRSSTLHAVSLPTEPLGKPKLLLYLSLKICLQILLKPGSFCVIEASHRSSQIHDLINFNCGTTTVSTLGFWSDVRKTVMTSVAGS